MSDLLSAAEKKDLKRKRVRNAVEYLKDYIGTYDELQPGYEDFSDETIINDLLYGLGVALQPDEYRFAGGFDKFKEVLRKHLGTQQ